MHADDRRRRVDLLFARCLGLDDERRAAFLDRACRGHPELRGEVESLLALAEADGPALEAGSHAADGLWNALAGEPPPVELRFGPWRVERLVGRGGMGAVYLVARADGQYEQLAALKVLETGLGGPEALRRFEQERQILASLNHAAIARLLDGGRTEDGRPFLVMEYVEGRPIDRYCDEERLTVEERLDLFLEVARAVEHAHRNLIVHRDVKPSNIAVSGDREVKLLDFGIARLLTAREAHSDAASGAVTVLTPEYASPEQVRGEAVTTASDIYQLGLLLAELLTGERAQPIVSTAPADLERAICNTPPIRPSVRVAASASPAVCAARRSSRSALARRLRGDLDDIVLCALRKEPERRYGSVGELVDDVVRHRRGWPIRARPNTPAYRSRKFLARHRAALAWGLVLALAAGWALTALAGQRLRAARAARRAAAVEQLLGDLFAVPNPRVRPHPPTARDYVDHAARLVASELRDQPVSQARLLTLLGRTYNALGLYRPSIDLLRRSLGLTESHLGSDSAEVAAILRSLARSEYYDGEYRTAERTLRRAQQILDRRRDGSEVERIRVRLELGDLLHTRGRLAEAEETLRDALERLGSQPEDRDDMAAGLRDLGNVLRDRGALAEAEARYRASIDLFRSLFGEPDQQLSTAEVYYARLLVMEGHPAEAEHLLVDNLAKLRRIYAGDHPLTGTVLRNLGYALLEEGRYEEAGARLAEAQRIFHRWLPPDHPMIPRTASHQAELERRLGHLGEAVTLARATLDRFSHLGLAEHPAALDTCTTLGAALLDLGRRREAAAVLTPCRAAALRQYVPADPRTALIAHLLGRAGEGSPRRRASAPTGAGR